MATFSKAGLINLTAGDTVMWQTIKVIPVYYGNQIYASRPQGYDH